MADPARARKLADRIKVIVAETLESGSRTRASASSRSPTRASPATCTRRRSTTRSTAATRRRPTPPPPSRAPRGVLRSEIGRQTGVRFTPTLTFVADAVPENAAAIEDLLAVPPRPTPRCTSRPRPPRTPARPTPTRSRATEDDDEDDDSEVDAATTARASPTEDDRRWSWTADPVEADWALDRRAPLTSGAPGAAAGARLARRRRPRVGPRGRPRARARSASTSPCRSATSPFAVPRVLRTLPGQHLLVAARRRWASARWSSPSTSARSTGWVCCRPAAEAADTFVAVDHHSLLHRFRRRSTSSTSAAPATAVLALELVDRLGVELDAEHRAPPLRRPRHRHRVVQVRRDHGRHARDRGAAARDRHAARPRRPPDLRRRAVRRRCGCSAPRSAGPSSSRDAVGGLGLVWTVRARGRPGGLRAADGRRRARDRHRCASPRRPRSPACSSRTTPAPGASRMRSKGRVDVSPSRSPSAVAVTASPPASPAHGAVGDVLACRARRARLRPAPAGVGRGPTDPARAPPRTASSSSTSRPG